MCDDMVVASTEHKIYWVLVETVCECKQCKRTLHVAAFQKVKRVHLPAQSLATEKYIITTILL